jgi:hypothetical protein
LGRVASEVSSQPFENPAHIFSNSTALSIWRVFDVRCWNGPENNARIVFQNEGSIVLLGRLLEIPRRPLKTIRALFLKTWAASFSQAVTVGFWDGPKINARIVFQNGLGHIGVMDPENIKIFVWKVVFHCLFS